MEFPQNYFKIFLKIFQKFFDNLIDDSTILPQNPITIFQIVSKNFYKVSPKFSQNFF